MEEEEEEEEKEVDPLLVGSLDNVYTDESTKALMMSEDPFKKAPVMDNPSVATAVEMEKTVDALMMYESESQGQCLSPLEAPNSPDFIDRTNMSPDVQSPKLQPDGVDLLSAGSEAGAGSHTQRPPPELLPDLVDVSSKSSAPTLQPVLVPHSSLLPHNNLPPDIATQPHPAPDLGAGNKLPLDLLNSQQPLGEINNDGQGLLVDLTEGVPNDHRATLGQ